MESAQAIFPRNTSLGAGGALWECITDPPSPVHRIWWSFQEESTGNAQMVGSVQDPWVALMPYQNHIRHSQKSNTLVTPCLGVCNSPVQFLPNLVSPRGKSVGNMVILEPSGSSALWNSITPRPMPEIFPGNSFQGHTLFGDLTLLEGP